MGSRVTSPLAALRRYGRPSARAGARDRALVTYLEGVLGPCDVTWVSAEGAVCEVVRAVDGEGTVWFGKRLASATHWGAEVRAYRHWVPAFADQAPELRAADSGLRVVVTTAVEGVPAAPSDPQTHWRAGALLWRIHRSLPPKPPTGPTAHAMVARFEATLRGRERLLSREELAFVRRQTRALADLPPLEMVPCHGDYHPRNWLVCHDAAALRVIDFAGSRWHVPAFDLTRLCFGPWWDSPELSNAFLEGYGRRLSDDEREFVALTLAAMSVNKIRRSHERGDAPGEAKGRERLARLMAGWRFAL